MAEHNIIHIIIGNKSKNNYRRARVFDYLLSVYKI